MSPHVLGGAPRERSLRSLPGETEDESTRRSRRRIVNLALGVAAIVFVAFVVAGGIFSPPSPSSLVTTSTTYLVSAPFVLSAAETQGPAGYSSKPPNQLNSTYSGARSSGFALISEPGSTANMTVIVFDTQGSAQAYFASFRSNVQGLSGYADMTSTLGEYQRYGGCYGFGEDVDGIAVVNGICTKGNVFLQVHLVSSASSDTAEGDMTDIMGSMYQALA